MAAAALSVSKGTDCSGNSAMGLGRCHFTSAIRKRSPLMMEMGAGRRQMQMQMQIQAEGGGEKRDGRRQEEAEGRKKGGGRNCVSWAGCCWLLAGNYL